MEQAVAIDLILERMFQVCPFEFLKDARLVNKSWNQIACKILRRRALSRFMTDMTSVELFIRREARLENQELLAKVSVRLNVEEPEKLRLYNSIQTNERWVDRVSVLSLHNWLNDVNQMVPFLLYRLKNVEKLRITYFGYYKKELLPFPQELETATPANIVLPTLRHFHVWFHDVEANYEVESIATLDPGFLLFCPNLQVFSTDISHDSTAFVKFAKLWTQKYSPALRVDHLIVDPDQFYDMNEANYFPVIVNFIEMIRPKFLQMNITSNIIRLRVLKEASRKFGTVTKLSLTEALWHPEPNQIFEFDWQEIFKGISLFPRLGDLCLEFRAMNGELVERERLMRTDRNVVGYLKDVGLIKGLSFLRVSLLSSDPLTTNAAILTLFRGWEEPNVELELKIIIADARYDENGKLFKPDPHQLTISEFQGALKAVEGLLLDAANNEAPQAGGGRRRSDSDAGDSGEKRAKLV